MSTCTRRISSALAGGLAVAALGLAAPEPASADDDHRYRNHGYYEQHKHHKHHKHKHHRRAYRHHQERYAPHYGAGAYGYGYPVHVHEPYCGHGSPRVAVHAEAFYCEPCGHHFGSLHDLHHHVHHHHHVPTWRLPYVVIQASVGWVFGG